MEKVKSLVLDVEKVCALHCRRHPNETVARICEEPWCTDSICCIECILDHDVEHKKNIKSIQNFAKDLQVYEQSYSNYSSNSKLPSKFQSYITVESENIAHFHTHIENQKKMASKFFDDIINDVISVLNNVKNKTLGLLDTQASMYVTNCKYFHDKITTFYKCDEADKVVQPTSISTYNDLEYFIHTKKIDKMLVDECAQSENFEIELMTTLNKYHEALLKQLKTMPKIDVSLTLLKEVSSNMKDSLQKSLDQNNFIIDEIDLICRPSSLESTILKPGEVSMVQKWLQPLKLKGKPKLIFKAKKDGFKGATFHQKCDGKGPTLVIVQSDLGKRFGGYAGKSWANNGSYCSDNTSFIFSIDDKEKYELKNSGTNQYAMCQSAGGPTFGGGHDFCIADNCNTSNSSYCNINHTYNSNGKTNINFTGAYNFKVVDYEVFQLTDGKNQYKIKIKLFLDLIEQC